ncbi:MAG: hypothetical protein GY898_31970 [Proteobacteria bacterium]|nr:hypothetical protein [Pseudomonadota bacterium]
MFLGEARAHVPWRGRVFRLLGAQGTRELVEELQQLADARLGRNYAKAAIRSIQKRIGLERRGGIAVMPEAEGGLEIAED